MSDRISLLVVEDEDDIRRLVELALELDERFHVTAFSSAKEALEALTFEVRHFDMALVDVRMPGMDGIEFYRRLRGLDRARHMPVIFMTASDLPVQISSYEEHGAVAVISKPFDPLSLVPRLAAIMDQFR